MDELKSDIKELRKDVKELTEVVTIASERVRQHEERSLQLQTRQDLLSERLKPIELHVAFVTWALKAIGALTSATAVAVAIKYVLFFLE